MANVQLYNSSLTPSKIYQLYKSGETAALATMRENTASNVNMNAL